MQNQEIRIVPRSGVNSPNKEYPKSPRISSLVAPRHLTN